MLREAGRVEVKELGAELFQPAQNVLLLPVVHCTKEDNEMRWQFVLVTKFLQIARDHLVTESKHQNGGMEMQLEKHC